MAMQPKKMNTASKAYRMKHSKIVMGLWETIHECHMKKFVIICWK